MQRCADCTTVYADGLAACPHCSSARRGGSALPSIVVACDNTDCPACGVERRITLATLVPGVVAMPRPLCTRCGLEMRIEKGWPPIEEEETVPKITRHGGPTIAGAQVVGGTWSEGESRDAWPEAAEPAPPAGAAPEEETVVETAAEPAAQEPPGEPEDTVEAEAPERPSVRDPRSAWLAYAQSMGVEGADQMTKAQLIETTKD